jgi:hypothetical protein
MAPSVSYPIILTKIQFVPAEGYAVLHARLADAAPTNTNFDMAAKACVLHPDLPAHTCKNGHDKHFAGVIEQTPLLHLFEHLVVDHLLEDLAQGRVSQYAGPDEVLSSQQFGDVVFAAATRYIDATKRSAQIKIKYLDDLALARAVGGALDDMVRIAPPSR